MFRTHREVCRSILHQWSACCTSATRNGSSARGCAARQRTGSKVEIATRVAEGVMGMIRIVDFRGLSSNVSSSS